MYVPSPDRPPFSTLEAGKATESHNLVELHSTAEGP